MIIFSFPHNQQLATKVAGNVHAELGKFEMRHFPDQETYLRIITEVAKQEVIVFCGLQNPNEKLMPLILFSRTLRDMGAKKVSLIAPYLCYMRQDECFHPGESLSANYTAELLSHYVDELITVDPHLHRYHSLSEIYSIPTTVIHAAPLFSQYIQDNVTKPVVIGPDEESEQWIAAIAEQANAPYVIFSKTRQGDRKVTLSDKELSEWKQYTPVLVDDIISTAKTMIAAVEKIKQAGLSPPICLGVHAIFADNAYQELLDYGVTEVITTNTIEHPSNRLNIDKLLLLFTNPIN